MDYSSIKDFLSTCERKCEDTFTTWQNAKSTFQRERRTTVNAYKKTLKALEKKGRLVYEPDYSHYTVAADNTCKIWVNAYLYRVTVYGDDLGEVDLNDARYNTSWCRRHPEAKQALEDFIELLSEA